MYGLKGGLPAQSGTFDYISARSIKLEYQITDHIPHSKAGNLLGEGDCLFRLIENIHSCDTL